MKKQGQDHQFIPARSAEIDCGNKVTGLQPSYERGYP
jgi:hypothetical protein